jgi:hypothetical protein
MNTDMNEALAKQCRRLADNTCLYTSTALFEWLRCLRIIQVAFLSLPIFLGSLATWNILTEAQDDWARYLTAICAFLAGLLPAIYGVLKLDEHIIKTSRLAGEFKNLQDRFEIAASVSSKKPYQEFESEVNELMERLERARSESYTPPNYYFRQAQKKIKKGDYAPD